MHPGRGKKNRRIVFRNKRSAAYLLVIVFLNKEVDIFFPQFLRKHIFILFMSLLRIEKFLVFNKKICNIITAQQASKKLYMSNEKKKKKEPSNENAIYKRKALGLVLGLIGIFLLLFAVFYVVSRILRPQELSTMLPENTTIAFMQVNINQGNEHVQRFYNSLSEYEVYSPDSITQLADELLGTDFETDIKPWINRQIGIAVLEKSESKGEMDMLLFVETKDKNATIDFMQSRGLKDQEDYVLTEEYNGMDIYRYALSQAYQFTFINNHMVVATNQDALKQVIDSHKGSTKKLVNGASYQKVTQNLPINTLIYTYVDFDKAMEFLKNNDEFMSEKGKDLFAFEPFLKLYKAIGTTVVMENGDLAVQTYTSLDEKYLKGSDLLKFDEKFRANLLSLMPRNVKFYAGGLNLKEQIYRYSELFSAGGEVSYLIFEGMLRAQKNYYLGNEITLEEDIYPLLEGEYAFALSEINGKQAVTILLELSDPVRDKDNIESIADSFIRKSAILAPKVVTVELEDGTKVEEIQTVPEEIIRTVTDYHGYEMNVLKIGNMPWGVYYIIIDTTLVVTTQEEQLQNIIDLMINPGESFKTGSIFNDSIAPVLRTTDEVVFIDLNHFLGTMKEELPDWLPPYLEPFAYLSTGKNYFKDGISTIHYIKVD